ncbi:efflux RND transporter periplasmic adaptor subunit [Telluribacter sp.]|jgi:RND family efflux transporter MFP subunit|uniref:efflux RND transporter periplasmic adaptor subunit n=1 Tax=Telluribacter sp. TaxID=1978767 RepID=UPI002E12E878|nr:efflux RND transporter periplasmic adaptor subunit [Telluribacter sp.]
MKTTLYLSLLALLLIITSCGNGDAPKETALPEEGTIPVQLATVETAVRTEPIFVSGTLASEEEARLSFKIGGIVSRIYVREGQAVRKGQLLAVLDLTEINAQVSQAQYATEKAERDMKRVQNMLRDTAATLEQMQNSVTGYDLAQQNLKIARFNQAYAQIISPLDGTVTRKLMNEGELASAGASALLVSSNRRNDWVVRVGVSDRDWARLNTGDRATVRLDAYPDDAFKGTVTKLAQAADPLNKLYEIEVRIDPAGKRFATGLFAKVELTSSQSRSYAVVPVEALVEGNGREGYVYVNQKGKAQRVPVTIGYLEGDKVLITNGLEGIREVITAGSAFLTANSSVLIKN